MIRTRHDLTEKTWFITFTCFEWISLFEITNSYHLVYNWLNVIDQKYQIKTLAFVIMPNHVHAILQLPESVKKPEYDNG
jgi:putative transposase